MGKHPKFDKVDALFEKGKDFQMTDAQYERMTGVMLPKRKKYIMEASALAKRAKEKGFVIDKVQEKAVF
ncbi:MAG: hypothetical protein IJS31_04575 [Oscillospiraceae bacterium]|nr:hypothetical protein [Oscillospiraceae bacterium]